MAPTINPSTSVAPSVDPSIEPSTAPSVAPSVVPSTDPTIAPSIAPSVAPSTTPTVKPSCGKSGDKTTINNNVNQSNTVIGGKNDVQNSNINVQNVAGDVNITTVKVTNNVFVGSLYIDYNSKKIALDSKSAIKWSGSKKIVTNQNTFTIYGTYKGKRIGKTVQLQKGTHDYNVELVAGDSTTKANVTATYNEDTSVAAAPIVNDDNLIETDTLPQTGETSNTPAFIVGILAVLVGAGTITYLKLKTKTAK